MNKQYRVKKSDEIESILKNRDSFGNKYFIVYKKISNEANFRYAISVGKKIGNAVTRNKVKRQVRAIVDNLLKPELLMDVFIVVRPNVLDLTYEQMQSQILYLFKKLNIEFKGAK